MPSVLSTKEPLVAASAEELEKILALFELKSKDVAKKKVKLSHLLEKQARGEKMNPEQLQKLSHIIGFDAQDEILRELTVNVNETLTELRKEMKEKDLELKAKKAEYERTRLVEMFKMNHVFNFLGDESIRKAITSEADKNCRLSKDQLANLDKFYKLVHPDVTAPDDASKIETWNAAARKLQLYMDSSRKKAVGSSCSFYDIRHALQSVYNSPYMTKPIPVEIPEPAVDAASITSGSTAPQEEAEPSSEKEFVVVSQADVPSADSQEVLDSFPPAVIPPTESSFTNSVDETPHTVKRPAPYSPEQPDPPAPLPSPQTFEKIVQKTQGSFNFIQDSQIDPPPVSLDPAVLSVQHMPNTVPVQHSLTVDPPMSELQFAHTQSVPIPTTVIENSLYSQQAIQQYPKPYQTPEVYQDPPQPIPLPGETPGFQEIYPSEPAALQQPNEDKVSAEPVNDRVSPDMSADAPSADFQANRSRDGAFNRRGRGGPRGRGPPYNGYQGRGGGPRGQTDRFNDRDRFHDRERFSDRERYSGGERRGGRGGYRSDRGDRGGYRGPQGPGPRGSGPKMSRGGTWSNSTRGSAPPPQAPQTQQ